MIRNITYNNSRIRDEINKLVGPSFNWPNRIKMGGIGSRRMLITNASPNIWHLLNHQNTAKYCYFELRPKGIIIHFRSILESMGWIISYRDLEINPSSTSAKIIGENEFMVIGGTGTNSVDHRFLEKVQKLQQRFTEENPVIRTTPPLNQN